MELIHYMENIKRVIDISLPKNQSTFLWGPRQSGKSTLLHEKYKDSLYYDFLKTDLYFEIMKNPSILRERILAKESKLLKKPIILDEVQKVPAIFDEVHWMIENKNLSFILCGSSARKIIRGQSNLLGGRAWSMELFPFVTPELKNFNLLKALNQGLLPPHYLQTKKHYKLSLKAYVHDYLKQEIIAEGLTRNIPAFTRFLDSFSYSHAEITNYTNIARDCGIDSKTVKEYYQILVDTLLAIRIDPYRKTQNRQVITKSPKYYLFDVGIANYLTNRIITIEKGIDFGKAFEHFILMEIRAYNSYKRIDFNINYWKTKTGLEVDFILGNGEVAIEVKGSKKIASTSLKGIKTFFNEHKPKRSIIVCNEIEKRISEDIEIIPWKEFLSDLWAGKIIR
jgi:uncharacterized protein